MIELLENIDVRDYTFILPTVSVGNVGQLTADLLIYTLQLKKLGYVWHPSIIPAVGPDPFGNSNDIATACELYYSATLKIIVLQIRSSFVNSKADFLKNLCKWIKQNNLKQLVILTGSFAHERRDKQLVGRPLRYVFCPITQKQQDGNTALKEWTQLESTSVENKLQESNNLKIPGSGIAISLYSHCIEEKIACSILIEFCSDGNNAPDALMLADYLNEWLQLREKLNKNSWIPPPSWTLLFGAVAPLELFN